MEETKEPTTLAQMMAEANLDHRRTGWLQCLGYLLDRDFITPAQCIEAREAMPEECK